MRLTELDAVFIKRVDAKTTHAVQRKQDADGVLFLCPKCFADNQGPIGTHGIKCWEPHVPQDTPPTPGRWEMLGNDLNDLTLTASSSSIALTGGCRAHFYVRNGAIEFC